MSQKAFCWKRTTLLILYNCFHYFTVWPIKTAQECHLKQFRKAFTLDTIGLAFHSPVWRIKKNMVWLWQWSKVFAVFCFNINCLSDCPCVYQDLWTSPLNDEWTANTMWHDCTVCPVSPSDHCTKIVQTVSVEATDWQSANNKALVHSLLGWPTGVMYALKPLQSGDQQVEVKLQ